MSILDDIAKQINYDSIPFGYPVIPYEDIATSDTYGRKLILPDDVLPTFSAMSGKGPTKPRLVTVTDDGYVNVNLAANTANVGAGGGGGTGSITPVAMTTESREGYNVGSVGGPISLGGSIPGSLVALYGFSCAWYYNYSVGNAAPLGNLSFYISDGVQTTVVHLCRFGVARNNFTADNGPPWITGQEQTCMYPIPIDGASWPSNTGLFIRANGDLINISVSATIWYKKGP